MAPISNQTRRARPDSRAGRRTLAFVQAVLGGTAWAMVVGWWLAPAASRVGVDWQWLAWIPDWGWLICTAVPALLAAALAVWIPGRRLGRLCLPLLAMVGPFLGVLWRDYGWTGAVSGPVVRLLFLNAQSPSEADAVRDLEAMRLLDPDLVVVLNPGWIAPVWRQRQVEDVESAGSRPWSIQWRTPVMTATPFGGCTLRTVVAEGDIRVMAVGLPATLAERLGCGSLLVVDLPSDPGIDRETVADRLLVGLEKAGLGRLDQARLVIGDFNMTPRTPALVRLRGDLRDLVAECGDGWTSTWPRKNPLLRIDQVLGSFEAGVRIETFDPGAGGHRGFVIDLSAGSEDRGS